MDITGMAFLGGHVAFVCILNFALFLGTKMFLDEMQIYTILSVG